MKKFTVLSLLFLSLLLLINIPVAHASTLYSNNLTTDFWNTFFSSCSTSSSGLTCSSPTDAVNTTYFSTLTCISGNFTSNGGPNQLFILDNNTNFNSYVVLYIQSGHNLKLNSNVNTIFDSGIASPTSGIHTYALCKSSDTYTSYLDGTLVQTQTFTGHTGGYIGLQTAPGEFLTNFVATDKLPGASNPTILYSNNFTSNFWNTFFGTCAPSSSGITCTGTTVLNTTQFPTVKCISEDADSSVGSPQLLFAGNPHLINIISVNFNNNSDILIKDISNNNTHTGVPVPTGAHNYGLCQGTNQLTIYIDHALIYTFNTIFPHLDFIGFTLFSGTTLTNYLATDTFPGNSSNDLPVPLLKQTDNRWGSQEYDSASRWEPLHPTIGDWGCAMTSAAMVLQYYGINKLPDNNLLDPGALNTWLKNQKDGYVGDGLINWLAISRLSKLAKSNNPNFSFDALEYRRKNTTNKTLLTTDINNNQPDILEEPGHYVVGKGINGDTFDINDPFYPRLTLNDGYNNNFLSLGRYIGSHTNLSYLLVTINPNVDVLLASPSGQKVGSDGTSSFNDITDANYYIQQGTTDPQTGSTSASLRELMLPTPAEGEYKIILSSTSPSKQNFTFTLYAYDATGSATINLLDGTVNQNNPVLFAIPYSQNPSDNLQNNFCDKKKFDNKTFQLHKRYCKLIHKLQDDDNNQEE